MATTQSEKVEGEKVRILTDQHDRPNQYIFCPACKTIHSFDDRWTFNNNFDKPTFKPSMLVKTPQQGKRDRVCHSFVTDGKIQYLGDCTHDMAGQTIDLPEITDEMW